MPTETPMKSDNPILIEWEKWKQTDEYKNALDWLAQGNYDGEMWAAFLHGWNSHAAAQPRPVESLVEAAREWMAKEYDIPLLNVSNDGRLEVMAAFTAQKLAEIREKVEALDLDAGFISKKKVLQILEGK